jgi:hypothetical protein
MNRGTNMERKVPQSVLDLKDEKRAEVLITLLQEDREEIRFWQERLFTTSFWINAAILGLVAFLFQLDNRPPSILKDDNWPHSVRLAIALGCICLTIFHCVITRFAKKCIETNGKDLLLIQGGLLLTKQDYYIREQSIYEDEGRGLPQKYTWLLIVLNILLCLGSVCLTLLCS